MTNKDYRVAYETAANELEQLLLQQEKIEERILSLRKTLNVLSTLIQESGDSVGFTDLQDKMYADLQKRVQTSLTDDIFQIVVHAPGPLTTTDVRNELNKLGGSLAEHKNPLATINAILGRLTEQDKLKETLKDGRKAWSPAGAHQLRFKNPNSLWYSLRGLSPETDEIDDSLNKLTKKKKS